MSVPISIRSESPPLRVDETGVVRVGNSRITLDLVVDEFENGMAPEAMVEAYDALELTDIYGAIAYYLSHRDEVRGYLAQRTLEADANRTAVDSKGSRIDRNELLNRRSQAESANASSGD